MLAVSWYCCRQGRSAIERWWDVVYRYLQKCRLQALSSVSGFGGQHWACWLDMDQGGL